MSPPAAPTPAARKRVLRRLARAGAVAAVAALVLLAAIYAAARVYLPALVADEARLQAQLGERLGHPVRVGEVALDWDGPYPRLRARGVVVEGEAGAAAVRIDEVRVRLNPLALLRGRVQLYRLALIRPRIALVREADGRIRVAGLRPGGDGASGGALAWLLRQPGVLVRDGELHWRDAREPDAALSLARVAIRLRNSGDRHRLSVQADFPDALCRRCALSADVTGAPGENWAGEIELELEALELGRLPLALRERWPVTARGRLDARVTTGWEHGRLRAARGSIDATGLRLQAPGRAPVALARAGGEFAWQARTAGWRLEISELMLGVTGAPWPAGRLRLDYGRAHTRLELEHLVLDDLAPLLAAARTRHPWLERLAQLAPRGALHDLDAEVSGPLAAPERYRLQARLDRIGFEPSGRLPGMRGVSGALALDSNGGALALEADGFVLHLPTVFRAPLAAGRASGHISWRRTEAAWHVSGVDLAVHAPDASGTGRLALELPHDRARSPVLDLRVDFRDGNGAHAARYYPAHKLPPRILAWMESAFLGGRISSGHLIYHGAIRDFPFERGEGRFALQAEVRDGIFRYLPGWEPFTNVQASVTIEGLDARISGSARVGGLAARDVEVTVGRAGASARAVRMHGTIEGPIAEAVRVLRAVESPQAPAWRGALARITSATGPGTLALRAHVPLGGGQRSFQADYRFEQAAFGLAHGLRVEAASGTIRLSETGLQQARVHARAYGGSLEASAARTGDGLRVEAAGDAQVDALLRNRGVLAERLDGRLDWKLAWAEADNGPTVRLEADLARLRARLPAPFDASGVALPRRLILTTQESHPGRMTVTVDGGAEVGGRLVLARADHDWRLVRGRLDIGRARGRLPAREGLELGIHADALDLDQWLALLAADGPGRARAFRVGINAQIAHLILFRRDWGRVFLNLARGNGVWHAVLDGDAAAGEATLRPGDGKTAPAIRLDLAFLRLPPGPNEGARAGAGPDPRQLPRIDMEVRSFEHEQRRYGELVLRAAPNDTGWRIERLSLARPETAVSLAGIWERRPRGDFTRLSLELESANLGETLDAWGIRDQVRGGRVKLHGNLAWPGTPFEPVAAGLQGRLEISAENGRFLQLDPGAARLFGLLDLRAIARYLTLDFSPALAKGLTFDGIHSIIAIEQGNASTEAFILSGPSLNLRAAGRVGLAREDYDLRLDVSPRVGDTLTLTTWGLFGPQAAAAVLAFKQLFRRQIEESTRISYTIKGPWEDPQIERVPRPAPDLPRPTP